MSNPLRALLLMFAVLVTAGCAANAVGTGSLAEASAETDAKEAADAADVPATPTLASEQDHASVSCWTDLADTLQLPCSAFAVDFAGGDRVCVQGPAIAVPVGIDTPTETLEGELIGERVWRIDHSGNRSDLPAELDYVSLDVSPFESGQRNVLVDPSAIVDFPCLEEDQVADDLESLPCRALSSDSPDWSGSIGSSASDAVVISNVRTHRNDACLRFVFDFSDEFAGNAATSGPVPPAEITATKMQTRIDFPSLPNYRRLSRMDRFPEEAQAFFVRHRDDGWHLQVAHRWAVAEVAALDNPTRLVIDLARLDEPTDRLTGPILGSGVILAEPIQAGPDLIPIDQDSIRIHGWAWPQAIVRLFDVTRGAPLDATEVEVVWQSQLPAGDVFPLEYQAFDVEVRLEPIYGNYALLMGHDFSGTTFEGTGQTIAIDLDESLHADRERVYAEFGAVNPPELLPSQWVEVSSMSVRGGSDKWTLITVRDTE